MLPHPSSHISVQSQLCSEATIGSVGQPLCIQKLYLPLLAPTTKANSISCMACSMLFCNMQQCTAGKRQVWHSPFRRHSIACASRMVQSKA